VSAAAVFFYLAAAAAIVSALGMVLNVRNTVAAAMSLVVTMIALAVTYVTLSAHLIAALQIMVYAGAIVVLFLFVVMLLNLRRDEFPRSRETLTKGVAVVLVLGIAGAFLQLVPQALPTVKDIPADFGSYTQVGLALYRDYVLAFEATSFLLLAAIIGAVVLAKRRLD
jgi:NADH-quinone oxidoreductase subunit J